MALSGERVRSDEETPRVAVLCIRHGVHVQGGVPILHEHDPGEGQRNQLEQSAADVEREHLLPTARREEAGERKEGHGETTPRAREGCGRFY